MPFWSVPTPAACVPSVNVPSPLFQKSWLVRKSAAKVRSGRPSSLRSEKRGEKRNAVSVGNTLVPDAAEVSVK
jgi:hypothetical protein